MLILRTFGRTRNLSRRKFHLLVAGFWAYAIVWLAATYFIWISVDWGLVSKILAELLLIVIGPDVEGLFMSYEKYLKEQKFREIDSTG